MSTPTKRVLLINLGGPRDASEIEKFLLDLFTDPYVFDLPLPEFLRIRLARFIARRRAPKVAHTYAEMGFGGGSPLLAETEKQAQALAATLHSRTGENWQVDVTMTCGYPDIRELPADRLAPTPDNIILPLYPQYSRSTVLSTAMIMKSILGYCPAARPGWVTPFFNDDEYCAAIADLIVRFFQGRLADGDFIQFTGPGPIPDWQRITLVFSAHGIPMRLIHKGDVYVEQVERNRRLIEKHLRSRGFQGETRLSFQSRVGPARWTEPNTIDMLQHLGNAGHERVAVYPISFVSDHLETLEEIAMQLREVAFENGIQVYYRIPAPGTFAPFIDYLADRVIAAARHAYPAGVCLCSQMGGHQPDARANPECIR
ncbi:MAG: ferrochelatase [Leptospiraceae bacterium]|nr:ferrochelatase [Leptospiraceae bacterium]